MADTPETPPEPTGPRSEADILADPHLREYLAGYQPLFHDLFLQSYATLLQQLHTHGKQYEKKLEYLLHQHDEPTAEHLWLIQHQKLFDLECQWRAGLVAVPGAQLSSNFEDWHDHITRCPVLTPISPEELALFDAFLAQLTNPDELDESDLCGDFWLHRRHSRLRAQGPDEEDEDLTEWTQFWDLHRGTGYLRSLPDVRGNLEYHYEKAGRKPAKPAPTPTPPDPRPQVPTYGPVFNQLVRELLRRYEPARLLRQFEARQQLLKDYDAAEDRLDLPLALERLHNAGPGLVPIQAHADWRQAIIQAASRHYLDQLRAALPQVYDAYGQRETLGIAHSSPDEDAPRSPRHGEHFKEQKKRILKGRRQLGEPENLDF